MPSVPRTHRRAHTLRLRLVGVDGRQLVDVGGGQLSENVEERKVPALPFPEQLLAELSLVSCT